MSVSRHLVSTSVQFAQSAARKTESDQWLSVAHLSGSQITSRARSHARAVLPTLIAQADLSAKTVPRQCRESVSANMVPRQDRAREVGDFSKPRRKPPHNYLRRDQGQNAVARTNLKHIVETGVPDANRVHCHLRNFFQRTDADNPSNTIYGPSFCCSIIPARQDETVKRHAALFLIRFAKSVSPINERACAASCTRHKRS